ncbi:hypothetical protein EPO05_01255 [Patescibacteria group bacterium]|nr:MAG: hypothetical protein EPO05_01255 [Patescibacteria group bacterium]
MASFEITPAFKGFATAQDFLNSAGTLHFKISKAAISTGGLVFRISDETFIFTLSFQNSSLVLQRNSTVSILTLDEFTDTAMLGIFVIWTFDKLVLYCLQDDKTKVTEVETVPCAPPASLLNWARRENLIPNIEYDTEESFRKKVCSCLQTIQTKIDETNGAITPFWNYQYSGSAIANRKPKKETEVQPIIQCLLSDQLLLSSIEIIPEYKTGVGTLDFIFVANIRNKGISKICAEFKNAHSKDLGHGLLHQLPKYMRNKGSTYGFYCVLNYKCEWFNKPALKGNADLALVLVKNQHTSSDPLQRNIRIIIYNLGKQKTASKR